MTASDVAVVVDRSRGKAWQRPDGRPLLAEYGLHTVVVSDRDGAHHANLDADVTLHLVDSLNLRTISHVVGLYADRVIGLTTTSELFLETVAEVREQFGMAGRSPDYSRAVRDKWLMKQTAMAHGIPAAWGVLASDAHWAAQRRSDQSRYFIKPRRLSGSRGTSEANGPAELARTLDSMRPSPNDFLVEEFVEGTLFHFDGFIVDGSLDFLVSAYLRPTHEAGGPTPLSSCTVDDTRLRERAQEFIAHVVRAFQVTDDVFHCEAFNVDDRFVFCEVAGRPGGAGVSEVFELVRGTDLRWAKTVLDLGLSPARLPRRLTGAHQSAGWTVLYDTPTHDPSFRSFDGHVYADIRPVGTARVRGHAGVGAATFVFVGDDEAEVLTQIEACERQARTSTPVEGRR